MRLKSTKIIKIYFLIFFSSLSIFLYLTLVARFRPDTFLALQRVLQCEAGPGDLAPSWSKLAPVPASLTWPCFHAIHRFYFYFYFFLFLDRLSLFHTTEMRLQTKKEIKKICWVSFLCRWLGLCPWNFLLKLILNSKCQVITATGCGRTQPAALSVTAALRLPD